MKELDENKYKILVEAVVDYAIYMLDPSGVVLSWNTGAARFKGYTADEIIGRHVELFYTPEQRQNQVPRATLDIARSAGRFEAEDWRVRKDGTKYWAHIVIDTIYDARGAVLGFAKVTRDLTEQRLAQELLRQTEDQFRFLVQGVTDYAICMLDASGIVTNWNTGAQRIKGFLPGEIIGKHFSEFYTEADRAAGEPSRSIQTALREGRFESEGLRVRKDGTHFWANVVIDPVWRPDGSLLGFAKVTRDITERRRAQEELNAAREALFHSQKLETIGQLTGGIAHDFNNLLMAVQSCLEIIRARVANDVATEGFVAMAIEGVARGASLTQRMLAFARRQVLHPDAIDITKLIAGMDSLLVASLGSGVLFNLLLPDDLPQAIADPNQLELALLNLCLNARDAMENLGTIKVTARGEMLTPSNPLNLAPGHYVCISVSDTGSGMDEHVLAKAAEPFFTTKGVGKGTGLGLSMVDGLAAQSGGRLHLISDLGRGTTAEIWLPAVDGVQAEFAQVEKSSNTREDTSVTAHVLVVDDDELVRLTTEALLEDIGFRVTTAASAEEAIAVLNDGLNIDIVLSDYAMPKMTGAQLALHIAQVWPALPIIIATGYAELPFERDRLAGCLLKPFGRRELVAALTSALSSPLSAKVTQSSK